MVSSTTATSLIEEAVQSLSKLLPLPILRSSHYSGGGNSFIQDTLDHVSTVEELVKRLFQATIVRAEVTAPIGVEVYQAYDIDSSVPYSVTREKVFTLMELGSLPKDTRVTMRYEHGALMFYLYLDETNRHLFVTRDLWFSYDTKTKEASSIGTGSYTHPNRLFYQSKYHNLDTTVGKLLTSRNTDHISSIHLLPPGYEYFADLPN